MEQFLYCGHCGKSLNKKNKKDIETGFCVKCRKPPPDGQMRFDGTIVKSNKPKRNKKKKKKKKR